MQACQPGICRKFELPSLLPPVVVEELDAMLECTLAIYSFFLIVMLLVCIGIMTF